MVALSIILLFYPGLNLGVDFTGGTILERRTEQNVTTDQVRKVLDDAVPEVDLSGAVVQLLDQSGDFMIRTRPLDNSEILRIDEAFRQSLVLWWS